MDRRHALGIGLVIVAGASFASGSIFATLSLPRGARLADAPVVAVPDRGEPRLAVGRGVAVASRVGPGGCRRRQLAVTLALGAVSPGMPGTYYAGIETIPAALAGVLVYIYPVFVAILSLRFATRLPGRRPWFALLLAVIGVVLALGGISVDADAADQRRPPDPGLGLDLRGLDRRSRPGCRANAATAWAATPPADAPAARDAAGTTAVMMTGTAAVFASWPLSTGGRSRRGSVPTAAWPYLVGIGFIASFLAIQALYAGARRIGAAQAALVSTVEPLFIVILSFLILDQHLAPIQLVGAGLILIGVVIAQTSPRPSGAPEPATPLEAEVEG